MRGTYLMGEKGDRAREEAIGRLRQALDQADAVVVGVGAGLSTAAGMSYGGARFARLFSDFERKYGFHDMYSGGFTVFDTPEEQWAYWSRLIYENRYRKAPGTAYDDLRAVVEGRDHFVITTNVDHQFQLAGFDKQRLYYTQGDYGLWQCSVPCHDATYDNGPQVRAMLESQGYRISEEGELQVPDQGFPRMQVDSALVPRCPRCGEPMAMNLRVDDRFVEDEGWHAAALRYQDFLRAHMTGKVVYLEVGVGFNTPGIIKYPFWQLAMNNPQATYACLSHGETLAPRDLADRAILVEGDSQAALHALR